MEKKKKQQFKEGAIVKIQLSKNKTVFGRLLPGLSSMVSVYDFVITENQPHPSLEEIVSKPIIFTCGFFRTIITKGIYEIIGYKELTEAEVKSITPLFTQDLVDIDDCIIFWPQGGERKATPEECVGLERSSVWDEQGIRNRIEDYYQGKKNFHVELDKVILSKDDPRYLPPPQALRWDFEKEKFYRTDK